MSRRAKIVCTLGPAVRSAVGAKALLAAGMDVARLNFSHGARADHEAAYRAVRGASDGAGCSVGILADLQGPKIRLGRFGAGPVTWVTGDTVTITTDPVLGSHDRVSTTYSALPADVAPGDRLLVDDGNVGLEVLAVDGPDVRCRVTEGGVVSDAKGINLPGVPVSAPALTDKDVDDLRFALDLGVDLVALSFVRQAADVEPVRAVMAEAGADVPVLAKLEKPQAVSDLEGIVDAFDGLMVARGDLGVEMSLECVPLVQKRAVQLARERAKPVIVATQMLESMVTHGRPTRAEVSDVANAVLDGADALMLSAETSVGAHPACAVTTMSRIIEAAETEALATVRPLLLPPRTRSSALARAAVDLGTAIGARALVAFTQTGETARRLSRHRSAIPLVAFTPAQAVRNRLALSWGVETFLVPTVATTDEMVAQVDAKMLAIGRARPGDPVVIVAGTPPGVAGSTNTLRVHELGGL